MGNPTSITVPTANGPVTVDVPAMVPTFDWAGILAIQAATDAAYVQKKNAELQAAWDQRVTDYNTMMASGSFPVIEVPVAPKSYLFIPSVNGSMPSWDQDGPAVVSTIPMATVNAAHNAQPNTQPGVIMIGARNGSSNWFTALKGDTFPNGMTTPPDAVSSDGVSGPFQKFGAPVGPGWYLKVN